MSDEWECLWIHQLKTTWNIDQLPNQKIHTTSQILDTLSHGFLSWQLSEQIDTKYIKNVNKT